MAGQKRKNRTFRIRESLDQKLIVSAHANGRSVSEEIEARLEFEFKRDEIESQFRAALLLAESRARIQLDRSQLNG